MFTTALGLRPRFVASHAPAPRELAQELERSFELFERVRREMDEALAGFSAPFGSREPVRRASPSAALYKLDAPESGYALSVDLPGVAEEDLALTVHEGVLSVRAARKLSPEAADGERYEVRLDERPEAAFEQSFVLPKDVDEAKIEASLERGVLVVTLPKLEAEKPRRIPIAAGSASKGDAQATS
jgi:HSP20 family protein